jgi:hypothetical protein
MTNGTFKKGEKRPNQGKRGPSKSTQAAREAIGAFVDGNAHRLTGWLDKVADGVLAPDGKWLIEPSPEKAFAMFQSVVEYHVPKLARTELTGKNGGPVVIAATPLDESL